MARVYWCFHVSLHDDKLVGVGRGGGAAAGAQSPVSRQSLVVMAVATIGLGREAAACQWYTRLWVICV